MSESPRSAAISDEDLVAYLDRELDEARTELVERALAESADLRRRVELLSRTFDLLDVLPRESASQGFAQRTLQSLHVETVTDGAAGTAVANRPSLSTAAGTVASGGSAGTAGAKRGRGAADRSAPAFAPERSAGPFRAAVVSLGAAGLVLCAVAGFLATSRGVADPHADLLENLSVVERLDLYTEVGSVEFLERLRDANVLPATKPERTEEPR